jgi:hypothetical protein
MNARAYQAASQPSEMTRHDSERAFVPTDRRFKKNPEECDSSV